jgi:hypothetical protein
MSTQMFDAVVECFEEEHWKYLWVETAGETRFFTLIPRKKGEFLGISTVREEQNEYVFSTYYEVKVPESKRQKVAAFLKQINDGLTVGNFEMNMEDGEVCFKTSVAVTDPPLPPAEIDRFVQSSLSTAERYLPEFMAVIRGA